MEICHKLCVWYMYTDLAYCCTVQHCVVWLAIISLLVMVVLKTYDYCRVWLISAPPGLAVSCLPIAGVQKVLLMWWPQTTL